ncbi:MAG: AraC family transcriptional regulator [Prevotellaceae bacterium]|jgi:AraC-like DNA-binding protein|nr:AraC family transcriptional regulator [Prevotellaceae bacterium]
MRNYIKTGMILTGIFIAIAGAAQVSEGLYVKNYRWHMHSLYYPKTTGCDSVYADVYDELWYYNSDILFRKMATEGRTHEIEDLLQYYYFQIMDYLPMEKRREEHSKMCEAARCYRSDFLQNEADFMEIIIETYPLDTLSRSFDAKIEKMNELVERAVKRGDRNTECVLLFEIFQMYKTHENYGKAFHFAPKVLQKAELLTIEECPMLRIIYSFIGDAYYRFKDYDRAFFCMRKVESFNGILFTDRHSFVVREKFAHYYASRNQLDSSDYYFRSMYDSREEVRFRASYDAVAAAGIAANMVKRGEYDKAVPLLERWLPEALRQSSSCATDIFITLAKCFIFKKQYAKASVLIDSAQTLMTVAKLTDLTLREKFYSLQCDYYKAVGNASLTALYSDSARFVAQRQAEKTSALIILRAEQNLFEIEKTLKDEQIAAQKSRVFFISVISLLSLLALTVLIFFYRKKQTAYRKLVVKSQQWAGLVVSEDEQNTQPLEFESLPDSSDLTLMEEIERLINEKKLYKNYNLTLDILSNELKINRNYISNAINRCRRINFNAYINEYRIKEAIMMISSENCRKTSIEDIAFEVGFSNRSVFSRTFKKITGLSPMSFINNK